MDGEEAFDRLMSLLDYPMFVVTTRADDELSGCLVGFSTQVSIDPPRFLVGLSKRNRTYRIASRADHLAVHLVPRTHAEMARLFGSETGDRVDKFERCAGTPARRTCRSSTTPRAGSSGPCSTATTSATMSDICSSRSPEHAPERFEQLVTFADVRDLEPGHEA